ncbi:Lon protease family protein [Methylovorus mays]|uniref:Lon protease family protein n=1 Tax=Methylovorus mays TaxID=184077 RepID=UPI001E2B0648|nr:AAA family ATPase [Methylovorus mays]MCB5205600.1 AAA family ATPase [Methylovorus mays]
MLHRLNSSSLTAAVVPQSLGFEDTSQLDGQPDATWLGQADAQQAAEFGLGMRAPGFNLLVLGEPGSGRTVLMQTAMQVAAAQWPVAPDLILLMNIEQADQPISLYLPAGVGVRLRQAMEQYLRQLGKGLPQLLGELDLAANAGDKTLQDKGRQDAAAWIDQQQAALREVLADIEHDSALFEQYLQSLKRDTLENLEVFVPVQTSENEGLLESFLNRYRVNLLVDNRQLQMAPVIYDNDPTFHSLFGGFDAGMDSATTPDFLRLRAGNLLRAHGGMLMLHLRDLASDQQSGSQIVEKLFRFLRNGQVLIEDSNGSSGHGGSGHFCPQPLAADVKLVLIATPEEYYELHDEMPGLARYFPVKVDFVDSFAATPDAYAAMARFIAYQARELRLPPFSAAAVVTLIRAMHRRVEDQARISTQYAALSTLMQESASFMRKTPSATTPGIVQPEHVRAAQQARLARHQIPEQQLRDSIVEGELMLRLHGSAVGQINGLSHIDLGDASFGSPIRISARCFAGAQGLINIDREVKMSGPNHDKGVFILQSWLSASFPMLTPLSLAASMVFEQEYHGVEGDSASCAELFVLLSALSGLPISQGIAVTGALNQHGEVTAIGGVNEKIEGYFRVCQRVGLDGSQGVIIPKANMRHLILDEEVIAAVEQGRFHLYAIEHVLEGMALLTGMEAGAELHDGEYPAGSIMGRVQQSLEAFRQYYFNNTPAR